MSKNCEITWPSAALRSSNVRNFCGVTSSATRSVGASALVTLSLIGVDTYHPGQHNCIRELVFGIDPRKLHETTCAEK